MRRRGGIQARLRGGALMAFACLAIGLAGTCSARSITIEDFGVAIDVQSSGDFHVTETIRLRFDGEWNGIHRLLPIVYRSTHGYDYRLRIDVAGVATEDGAPLRYENSRDRHYRCLKIFIPGAADTSRTIEIRYTVHRGLRFFPDHDELYWNVTGDEWPFPITAARARITLPGEALNVRANAFTGAMGSRERAVTISVDGRRQSPDDAFIPASERPLPTADRHVLEIVAARPLGIREGLTAAVAWNPGAVRRPSELESWIAWLRDNLATVVLAAGFALAPVVAFVLMLSRWLAVGRDPRPGPVVVQYEPPVGLGPAEVGTLVDNSADVRDLMAMLVDLAVKGCIRIRQIRAAGWGSRAAFAFDLLAPEPRWESLPASEATFLRALFRGLPTEARADEAGVIATVTSDSLENRFHKHLPAIRSAVFRRLVDDGLYVERPDHVVSRYVATAISVGLFVAVVLPLALPLVMRTVGGPVVWMGIAATLATVCVVCVFGLVMPARTKKGAATRTAILGFEEFLSSVDAHRLASLPLTPELFEKYLPYAMALGVEGRWARAFADICREPPQWYAGATAADRFRMSDFTSDLSQFSSATSFALESAPRSSGGSGFGNGGGGGGYSGGGFGGGGGSGF